MSLEKNSPMFQLNVQVKMLPNYFLSSSCTFLFFHAGAKWSWEALFHYCTFCACFIVNNSLCTFWGAVLEINIIIIRPTYTNVYESMGKPWSCIQFIKSSIFTASHVRICISTTSHAGIRIRYCKSRALHLNVQWNRRSYMIKSLSP